MKQNQDPGRPVVGLGDTQFKSIFSVAVKQVVK